MFNILNFFVHHTSIYKYIPVTVRFITQGSSVSEEKELLNAMLLSLEVPIEKIEEISFLIDRGFSANQVALAITENNSFDLEELMKALTDEARGMFYNIDYLEKQSF